MTADQARLGAYLRGLEDRANAAAARGRHDFVALAFTEGAAALAGHGDIAGQIDWLHMTGRAWSMAGDVDGALSAFHEQRTLLESGAPDSPEMAICLGEIGHLEMERAAYRAAVPWLEQSLARCVRDRPTLAPVADDGRAARHSQPPPGPGSPQKLP